MFLVLFYIVHVVISLFLIGVVLLQQGKGADLAVFGGGGTMTAFGARGAANVLHKLTVTSFVLFIVTTMTIGFMQSYVPEDSVMSGVVDDVPGAPDDAIETNAIGVAEDDVSGESPEGSSETSSAPSTDANTDANTDDSVAPADDQPQVESTDGNNSPGGDGEGQ